MAQTRDPRCRGNLVRYRRSTGRARAAPGRPRRQPDLTHSCPIAMHQCGAMRAEDLQSELFLRPIWEMWLNNFDHAVGRGAGRKEADVLSVLIDQVDERRVVDDVIGAARGILGVVDLV